MTDVKAAQAKLIKLGYDLGPGKADGIVGRMTIAAITKFQADRRLAVTSPGTLDSLTLTALGLQGKVSAEPIWITEARRFIGLHEDRDAAKLDKAIRLNASEIAWCGAFTGMVVAAVLPSEPLPANPLGARNWLKFGRSIPAPQIGAVAVFWRGSKTGWSGHVGFVVGHDKTHLQIFGGNQSDKVSVARIAKNRLLGLRWPLKGGDAPTAALPMTTITASITSNEA